MKVLGKEIAKIPPFLLSFFFEHRDLNANSESLNANSEDLRQIRKI